MFAGFNFRSNTTDNIIKVSDIDDSDDTEKYSWLSFWRLISLEGNETRTFLLFAQKDYINETFARYNPASLRDWDSHDRPWDYDHIIPKSWTKYQRVEPTKSRINYWIVRIGNFAAIPFSENRSKSDSEDSFEYYEANSRELLFDKQFEDVKKDSILEKDCAKVFAGIVFNRTMHIYEKCYSAIKEWIPSISNSDEDVKKRYKFLEALKNEVCERHGFKTILPKPTIYYYDSSNDRDIEMPNRITSSILSSPYLTVGIPEAKAEAFIVGFTWGLEDDGSYEIGLRVRKGVNKTGMCKFNNKLKEFCDKGYGFDIEQDVWWWYLRKIYDKEPKKAVVLDDLRKLLDAFKDMLQS